MISHDWFCTHCKIMLSRIEGDYQCAHCGFTVRRKAGYFDAGSPLKLNFSSERRNALSYIEDEHFWFGPRDALLRSILKRIAPSGNRIIELGCGTGRFFATLKTSGKLIVGIDAFENSIQKATSRQKDAVLLHGDVCAVPIQDGTFDVAVSMDVLEHVDPVSFLTEAHRLVRQGGWLLLSAPSDLRLWSEADARAGHRCRYTLKMLSEELKNSGWRICGYTHYQYFLYPLMVLSRVFLRGKSSMERYPYPFLNKLLELINIFEVSVFSQICLPRGSSLIVWARKT